MKRRALLGALSGVAVAGCLRLSSGEEDRTGRMSVRTSSTATATKTAAETDPQTTTGRVGELEYPSGLSDDGIGRFLFAFHTQALSQASFHTKWSKVDADNSRMEWQKEYRVDDGTAYGSWTRAHLGTPCEIYRDSTDGFWREDVGDHYTYGNDRQDYAVRELTWKLELEPLLRAAAWNKPTLVTEEYPAVWRVESAGIADETAVPDHYGGTLQDLSVTAEVDENAIIRSVEATYRVDQPDGDTRAFLSRFELDSLGQVSVSEPAWVATAADEVPTVSATFTDDRRFVKLTIDSGARIEPESVVYVPEENGPNAWEHHLDDPIEPGVEVYLYRDGSPDAFGSLNLVRGAKPTGVTPSRFAPGSRVLARRRSSEYFDPVAVE
ncbi:hypothetical protein [Haloarchaeobius amylolyticus]|uniref:hypothetical protein n=1 Tax=Haloarchaeobius amylolyticus TaxID=1198296 RepID=UPI00226EE56B|nr:hypothetical protein [Haloarchaeobius amylolyticus]